MDQASFESNYRRISSQDRSETQKQKIKESIKCSPQILTFLLKRLLSFLPILHWLPRYKITKFLPKDIITGLIVGIMNVPQGMAYASLAEVPPVYGLYTAFFAGFFYIFFGTSKHISVGVFAVGSLMVGSVRLRLAPDSIQNSTLNSSLLEEISQISEIEEITPDMVISALTFGVGIVQVILGLLHLSFVTTYMTDQLVSGYTTGSAFHVLASQLDKLFGVKINHYEGTFVLYYMVRDVILLLPSSPVVVIIMSIIGVIYLFIGRELINPFTKKFCPIPIPHELILVIAATIFSYFTKAKTEYHVKVVDNIPKGFPAPTFPRIHLISSMVVDCIVIAIIAYMFVISMAKLFAKKHKYQVDDNQELFAIGFTSILSSFFPTYPAGASLSRSSVCEMSGVKTQLYGAISSTLLLIVIVWLGPLLEPLPMCILACIIAVSLKGLFLQFGELPRLWRISKYDFAIWLVACFSTIITDPTYGLGISLAFVLLTVLIREQWPKVYNLSTDTNFESFKSSEIYQNLIPINENIKIIKFNCPLHFANVTKFTLEISKIIEARNHLERPSSIAKSDSKRPGSSSILSQKIKHMSQWSLVSSVTIWKLFAKSKNGNVVVPPTFKPQVMIDLEQNGRKTAISKDRSNSIGSETSNSTNSTDLEGGRANLTSEERQRLKKSSFTLIIDCSAMAYMDAMGIEALREVYLDGTKAGVKIIFADMTDQVLDTLECADFYSKVPKGNIFPTIRHALLFLGYMKNATNISSSSTSTTLEAVETKTQDMNRSKSTIF